MRNRAESDYSLGCGAMNFLMASKDLWYGIGGLNELPYNKEYDVIEHAKFMKIVPGIPEMFFPFKGLHVYIEKNDVDNNEDNELNIDAKSITDQYLCTGEAPSLKEYGDSPRWGLPNAKLATVVK